MQVQMETLEGGLQAAGIIGKFCSPIGAKTTSNNYNPRF